MKSINSKQSIWQSFDIEVTSFNYSKSQKNGLMGYANVYVSELDIALKSIPVFNNKGDISVSSPANPPSPENNNTWYKIMDFYSKHDQQVFEKKVLEAFAKYCRENDIPLDLGSGMLHA